jgi:hypothetical protein
MAENTGGTQRDKINYVEFLNPPTHEHIKAAVVTVFKLIHVLLDNIKHTWRRYN